MTGSDACQKVLVVFLSALFIDCGGAVIDPNISDSESSSENQPANSPLIASSGQISELTIANGTLTLDLEDEEPATLMIVGMDDAGNDQTFELSANTTARSLSSKNSVTASKTRKRARKDTTEILHARLRGLENEIPENVPPPPKYHSRFAQKNSGRTFKVMTSFSDSANFTTVTASLAYVGDHFNVYVDNRDAGSVPPDALRATCSAFDAVVDTERALFGSESDVDGNGKFLVLLTREINAIGDNLGGVVTGYFYGTDLFDEAAFPESNGGELIYGMVPNPDGALGKSRVSLDLYLNNILPGVLPHEYQHMINFNRHRFLAGTKSEAAWLNEGLSHLAEDVYSTDDTGYMRVSGIENSSRAMHYLRNISEACLSCGTTLAQRGGSYLFLRYLYEQAEQVLLTGPQNGAAFLEMLTDGYERGIPNLREGISGEPDDTESFATAFANFGAALALSHSGASEDARFNFSGINLRAAQDDNRGTILNGPSVTPGSSLPLVDKLTGMSFAYVSVSKADASSFRLDVADAEKVRAYLIR